MYHLLNETVARRFVSNVIQKFRETTTTDDKARLADHDPNVLMESFLMSDPELLEIWNDLNEK